MEGNIVAGTPTGSSRGVGYRKGIVRGKIGSKYQKGGDAIYTVGKPINNFRSSQRVQRLDKKAWVLDTILDNGVARRVFFFRNDILAVEIHTFSTPYILYNTKFNILLALRKLSHAMLLVFVERVQ